MMKYLEKDDLKTHAFERFIDESSKDFDKALDNAERENIGIMRSYLAALYDVNSIFDANNPIKNPVLVRILSKMVLYDIIRRNAARKVPTDYVEEYKDALKTLEQIAFGKLDLADLPPALDEDGEEKRYLSFGNNTNPNFYI